jgi:lipase
VIEPSYSTFDVDVVGGRMHTGRWGSGAQVVVAAHGITATHRSFRGLANSLGEEVTVFAPDLRGRGRSNSITGPFSISAHADDLVAVLDHVGIERATVVGHSMGAFVAVVAAHRHPQRVRSLILVDGGLPLDLGTLAGEPIDTIVAAIIGPALERLRLTFGSVGSYLDFWRRHPAFAADWNAWIEDAFAYDLEGDPPSLHSGVRETAVLADAQTQLVADDVARALDSLNHPAVLLRAPAGIMGAPPGLYTDVVLAPWLRQLPTLREVLVPDVNHYTILLSERGAAAVAQIVGDELGS